MRERVEDLWRDLRERRLWPVALLLALALVLVPALLLEPVPEAPPQPATAPAAGASAASPVALESRAVLVAEGSNLEIFSARDPFQRPRPARRRSSSGRAGGARPSSSTAASSPRSGRSSSGSPPATSAAPASPPASGRGAERPAVGAESARYTDVVDIRYGERGAERTVSAVARMRMLPSEQSPVVTFLGPSASGRSAVFLLDSAPAVQAGDGACEPSPKECRFLSLRLDRDHDQHFFTDAEGTKRSLRLLGIERLPVGDVLAREARREQGGAGDRQ